MKKFALLSLMLFIAIILTACGSGGSSGSCEFYGYPNTIGKITLSKYSFNIGVGYKDKVIVYVDGKDKTNEAVFSLISEQTETNSKNIIANIDKGTITAIKVGIAVINVHVDNTEEDKTFTVNVIDPTLPTLQVVKNEINYEIGQDTTDIESIIVTLNGQDVTDKVNFTSTDENVATVDENGNINIIGEGETQIIIHLDGANDQIVTIKVTLPELEINKSEINLVIGEEAENQQKNNDDITVKLRGEDQIGEAIFVSSDPNVATVDQDGHITAISEGTAIIKVSVEGAKTSEIKVNVYDPDLHKIILQSNSLVSLQVGQTEQIAIFIKDKDKTEQAKYTIEDDTVISVSDTGLITALKEGTTKIKVHLDDTEADIEITVDVYDPELHTLHYTSADIPTQTIDGKEYMIMYEGETGHIQILVAGEDKTKDGVYTSGNTAILTVENTEQNPGLITAIKKGDTTITLHHDEALEGDVVVNVKVKEKPTLVTTELNIIQGYTGQIVINSVGGEDITNKFTFTSADTSIATVDSNGKVTLKQEHNTTITATYDDGTRVTTYTIPVKAQKTLTNSAGINSTALSASEAQKVITALLDTGMLANENYIDNIIMLDQSDGLTQIIITIDRPDGTKIAVISNEDGTIKYISTEEVTDGQISLDVSTKTINEVGRVANGDIANGTINIIDNPGFYDENNAMIATWDQVVAWGWNVSRGQDIQTASDNTYDDVLYRIMQNHPTLLNAKTLVFPDTITSVGGQLFNSCGRIGAKLETVVLPNNLTDVSATRLLRNSYRIKLQNVTIRSDNPNFCSVDGVWYSKDKTTLHYCPTSKTKLTIPNTVTYIDDAAFIYNECTSVGPTGSGADIIIPNSVTIIGGNATFAWSNAVWIQIPETVTEITSSEFASLPLIRSDVNNWQNVVNSPLRSIYIPSSVTTMPQVTDALNYYRGVARYTNATIYCGTSRPTNGLYPTGWGEWWNAKTGSDTSPQRSTTVWGVSRATYENNYRN